MKAKKFIALLLVLFMFILMATGCNSDEKSSTGTPGDTTEDTKEADKEGTKDADVLTEGKDTNDGHPYNLAPAKYDSRDEKYLNGINGTKLPVTDKPVTLVVWRGFSSNIMQGLDESEVFKEMEKRTGVKVEFMYPPVGQETDNFNIRISSDDLPHIFSTPPEYAGGYKKAVEDDVYIELTPYYDKGLMPNIKWLRENNKDINRDIIDDEGRLFFWPMIDIVPSDPWSGLWVCADWCQELGLDLPKTIS